MAWMIPSAAKMPTACSMTALADSSEDLTMLWLGRGVDAHEKAVKSVERVSADWAPGELLMDRLRLQDTVCFLLFLGLTVE
jgi:hypothetical protein